MTFTRRRRPSPLIAATAWLLAVLAGCATGPTALPTDLPAESAPAEVAAAASAAASAAEAPLAAASAPAPAASAASAVAAAPVDPLRPEVRLDLEDRSAQVDLWTRVRDGFTMPDLDDSLVRSRERWYADRPDYVQRMTERGSRYLFHIVEEVDKRGLPLELALLPFIESAFNPQALSSARASGIWQFMPSTGRVFELRQNVFRDDRRDVLASTRAALDYLEKLHGMFGDWHLALAAYNWGEGNVQRAIARNRRLGKPTEYTHLRMPAETRLYVRKLQAVENIVRQPETFGLELPELANHPYFLAVAIERDIDVELAASLAELPLDEFKALNPQMNRPVILAAGTPQVLLPYDNANLFVRALATHEGALASWTAWVAPKTLSTVAAAKMVDMDEAELREVNHIPPRMLIRSGSTLLVPRNGARQGDVSEHLADHATMALAPDAPGLRRLSLRAGRKESVRTVARRYRLSPAKVALWNGVAPGARFRPGQTVVVYLAAKSGSTKSARSQGVRKSARKSAAPVARKKTPVKVARN